MIKHDAYQLEAVARLVAMRCALLDAPLGSGKTAMGAKWLNDIRRRAPHQLLIAPQRLIRHVWTPFLAEHYPDAVLLPMLPGTLYAPPDGVWTIGMASNRTLRRVLHTRKTAKAAERLIAQAVIIDEATTLTRGVNAKTVRAWLRLVDPAYRLGLTGTPFARGLAHAWALYALVTRGQPLGFQSQTEFMHETHKDVAPRHMNFPIWVPRRNAKKHIARRGRDVTLEVTPPYEAKPITFALERIGMTPNQTKLYRELKRLALDEIGLPLGQGSKTVKLRQFAQGIKRPAAKAFLTELREPCIIWIDYKTDREFVHDAARSLELRVANVGERDAIDNWNKRKLDVLLAHPAEAAHGLNLQRGGRLMLFYTLPWSLELYEQAIGRLARRGQKETVHVVRWVIGGTVEQDVVKALDSRKDVQREMRRLLSNG